jgi:acylphosphatase
MAMMYQYEIRIYGRVQGVGFRYAARNQARSLALKGWVKNQEDGSVCAVIQGSQQACLKFMDWCRQGTGYSWVERVDFKEMKTETLASFSVRY